VPIVKIDPANIHKPRGGQLVFQKFSSSFTLNIILRTSSINWHGVYNYQYTKRWWKKK